MPLQATSGAASYDGFGGGVAAVPNYIEDVFSTYLYTGNGSTQTITNGIDLSTKGGLVWLKSRSTADNHFLFDTTRGATKLLQSNTTGAEITNSNTLTSFASTGFSLGTETAVNRSGTTFASWTFREQPKFFDVVTWTGNGVLGRQISHSLGSVPGAIIVKCTSNVVEWVVYHRFDGTTAKIAKLNTTAAAFDNNASWFGNGSVAVSPTSSVFTVSDDPALNNTGYTYVAYVFAHNAGGFGLTGTDNVISCGSYTGNGLTSNTVTLGYEPQWLLIKSTSTANWMLFDVMRGMTAAPVGGTPNDAVLNPNLSGAETSTVNFVRPTATGFELTVSANETNADGEIYIYIAIRRGPMKVPTSGTKVFNPALEWTPNSNIMGYLGAPADFGWIGYRNGASINVNARTRLTGGNRLSTSSTAAEIADTTNYWDNQLGFNQTAGTPTSIYAMWTARRAPSFMDVVCYTGTGSATTQTHNLQVVPELIIVKRRNTTASWLVYSATLGNSYSLVLNTTAAVAGPALAYWNNTSPTSSVFSVGTSVNVNGSGDTYVAYLFATCAGVSKVGSYTGTGTSPLSIDCGFTGGARFVMIKRTDSTGDWYVWDTARGMVSGNDSYLLLNSTAAEVTNTDYIDTYSAGFEISSTAPAAINASGGSFIFFAVA